MHVKSLSVLGQLHHLFCTSPILVLSVLSKKLLLKSLDALCVALAVKVGSLLHSCEWSPRLWIYDISTLECFLHIVGNLERSAGLLSILLCYVYNVLHYIISFRMSKNYFHTKSCEKTDYTLRYGKWLSVRRRVCPSHSQLLTL